LVNPFSHTWREWRISANRRRDSKSQKRKERREPRRSDGAAIPPLRNGRRRHCFGRDDREEKAEEKAYTEVTESAEFREKRNPRTSLKTGHYKPKKTQDPGTDSVPGATSVDGKTVKE
jgi:hypothetical protein